MPAIKLTILDAEVLWNPFDDLQPRVDKEEKKAAREEAEALAKVRYDLQFNNDASINLSNVCQSISHSASCHVSGLRLVESEDIEVWT